jgi:hypothetical protein
MDDEVADTVLTFVLDGVGGQYFGSRPCFCCNVGGL